MYRCDCCGKITEEKEKQNKVAITREKEYEHFRYIFDKQSRRKKKEYFTTTGYETQSELNYCDDCFKKTEGVVKDGENTQRKRRRNQIA